MESKAKLLGHPIHQMLIPFPLGLLVTSLLFDAAYWFTGNGRMAEVAYWMIVVGVISGMLAAVFGAIDFWAIPKRTRAKAVGLYHGVGNVVVVGLFIVSWWMRRDAPMQPDTLAIMLSLGAVALGTVTAWLGGELVDRLGVGVDDGANLNAPSSLTHRSTQPQAGR
jgi:uncharacterized membrane protein